MQNCEHLCSAEQQKPGLWGHESTLRKIAANDVRFYNLSFQLMQGFHQRKHQGDTCWNEINENSCMLQVNTIRTVEIELQNKISDLRVSLDFENAAKKTNGKRADEIRKKLAEMAGNPKKLPPLLTEAELSKLVTSELEFRSIIYRYLEGWVLLLNLYTFKTPLPLSSCFHCFLEDKLLTLDSASAILCTKFVKRHDHIAVGMENGRIFA